MADTAGEPPKAAGAVPEELAQLLAAARSDVPGSLEHLLRRVETAHDALERVSGVEYLLFVCADIACAVPLAMLREVLPSVPKTVPLPFSPDWMLGIFPLRSEMLGLVDPAPLLLGSVDGAISSSFIPSVERTGQRASPFGPGLSSRPALVVGDETRSLAWAVSGVGDIAVVQEADLLTPGDVASRVTLPFDERYVSGLYIPGDDAGRYVVLQADRLLDDLLAALEERDDHNGRA